MRAVKFYGVGDVRAEQVEKAVPAPDQALVRVLYSGICGSDLHIYREGMFVAKMEEIMGHEFVGRVESVPAGSPLSPGGLVVGDPRVPCGQCLGCQAGDFHRCSSLGFIGEVSPGCFAEYLAIAPEKLIPLTPEVDPVQGALAEPLAVAVHACHRIRKCDSTNALIVGAGPIGLLIATLLINQYGLEDVAVADIDSFRLSKAREAGVTTTMASAKEAAGRYDCIVDAVGLEVTLAAALESVRPGGSIYVSAIYEKLPVVDINLLVGGELHLVGNNAYGFEDMKEAAAILNSGTMDFSWLVTRILPAEQAADAFRLLTAREKQDLKILLDFQ